MPSDERASPTAKLSRIPDPLRTGEIEIVGLMPNASNSTFLVRCRSGDQHVLAIYKPRRGEAPLWDFPTGTLHRREVAAYEVASTLGWPSVPPTLMREGPHGPGSLQLFVRFDPTQHYFTLDRPDDFRKIALFDLVVNNADRKAGHCLLGDDGTVWVIDHGVCFHAEPKLRTVIWDFVGEDLPAGPARDLASLRAHLDADLGRRLVSLLAPAEVQAMRLRADRLVAAPRFPEPDPSTRPWPWPPI